MLNAPLGRNPHIVAAAVAAHLWLCCRYIMEGIIPKAVLDHAAFSCDSEAAYI